MMTKHPSSFSEGASKIVALSTAGAVLETLCSLVPQNSALASHTILFVDIDDTLITPQSKAFRIGAGHNLIDQIKQDKDSHKHFDMILSQWRLTRRIMLLDPEWPAVLEALQAQFQVYGLTKVDTGAFGLIASMEEWRYQELKSLGLIFSAHPQMEQSAINHRVQTQNSRSQNQPIFYQGIFMTGALSKGQVLDRYQRFLKAQQVILIDDRIEYLHEVEAFCKKNAIAFMGILFEGVRALKEREQQPADPLVVAFQKKYLLEHQQWLEDEAAIALMLLQ